MRVPLQQTQSCQPSPFTILHVSSLLLSTRLAAKHWRDLYQKSMPEPSTGRESPYGQVGFEVGAQRRLVVPASKKAKPSALPRPTLQRTSISSPSRMKRGRRKASQWVWACVWKSQPLLSTRNAQIPREASRRPQFHPRWRGYGSPSQERPWERARVRRLSLDGYLSRVSALIFLG